MQPGPAVDPETGLEAETRFIQPFQATKRYLCPGCNQEIEPRTGHLVVVPIEEPDLRRHWHTPCWQRASRRRSGPSRRPRRG